MLFRKICPKLMFINEKKKKEEYCGPPSCKSRT